MQLQVGLERVGAAAVSQTSSQKFKVFARHRRNREVAGISADHPQRVDQPPQKAVGRNKLFVFDRTQAAGLCSASRASRVLVVRRAGCRWPPDICNA